MTVDSSGATWSIVPYEGDSPFKKVRIRDDGRVRDVLRHLQAHECVALIGPPFSEKSPLLRDVAAALRQTGRFHALYLDLWLTDSRDEAAFFTSLGGLIEATLAAEIARGDAGERGGSGISEGKNGNIRLPGDFRLAATGFDRSDSGFQVPACGRLVNSRAFQNYLSTCLDAQNRHLALLIDHLQALPHDLVHSLLLALRAAYMEWAVDSSWQLTAVVTGGMNLVGLSASTTSPYNIARPVLATPITPEQSSALADATLAAYGCTPSAGALARIVEWAGGDSHIIPQLCAWCAGIAQGRRHATVDRRTVDSAVRQLLESEKAQLPIQEAIRTIEEDPDTILDVLSLLQNGTLTRSRARQMPTRTGADRLQLSGAVLLVDGSYTLKNLAYREVLSRHFTTERVGHILRIAGRWQEAIAYLAPKLPTDQGQTAQAQLLEATVQAIYATDSLARSWELLARGLEQGFGLSDLAVYRAVPAYARLELVHPGEPGDRRPASISLHDPESVEVRTYVYGWYALRGSGENARLVVALSSQGKRIGVITVDHYSEYRNPQELPRQLPELLHFLSHAAGAIENVMIRAAYREIGQAVLDANTLQPMLHRVLEVVAEALACDAANLYLLDPGQGALQMAAGVGPLWSPESPGYVQYALSSNHPAAVCLQEGKLKIVSGSDERLNRALVDRFGLQRYTWLFLPLLAAGNPLGTLGLGYSELYKIAPTEETRVVLSGFANQVAIAVHNMQLLHRTDEALARRVVELEKLRSSSLTISASLDVSTVLARIIRDVQALFPSTETTIWGFGAETEHLTILQSSLRDPEYLAGRLAMDSVTGQAVLTRRVQIIPDITALPAGFGHSPAGRLGLHGLIAVPLVSHDRVLGAINLYSYAEGQTVVEEGAADLLQAFAAHAAVAMENAHLHEEELVRLRLQQELEVAHEIQRSMLPTDCPQIEGWQLAAAYRSARVVSGDFYDFCELPGNPKRLGIVVADVTDKGVPAALFMAFSRTLIRTMAMSGRSPAAVLMQANRLILADSRSDVYLTAAYAVLELATGRLVYANAGHCRPLLYRAADATVSELIAPGVLLGAFDTIRLTEARLNLKPGDVLLFYTDGVTDALGEGGDMFGDGRLANVLRDAAEGSAEEILDSVLSAVIAFSGTAEQTDDITCVVAKRD